MRRPAARRFVLLTVVAGILAALLVVAGCAPTKTTSAATGAASSGGEVPTLKLVEPAQGAELPAGTIRAAVETTGLKFVMPSNTNVAGEGHVHFTIDDRPFVMSTTPDVEIKDVAPGSHTLKAELVQNNTQPFDPPIEQTVEFTVK